MVRNETAESVPTGILLYRDMDIEGEGPMVGPNNFALGVRTDGPPLDIEVRDGYVGPASDGLRGRGMSVAPGYPRNLNPRHRPPPLKALDRTPYGIFHPMISVRVFVIGRPERPTA